MGHVKPPYLRLFVMHGQAAVYVSTGLWGVCRGLPVDGKEGAKRGK